jgi:hypothetical protein
MFYSVHPVLCHKQMARQIFRQYNKRGLQSISTQIEFLFSYRYVFRSTWDSILGVQITLVFR